MGEYDPRLYVFGAREKKDAFLLGEGISRSGLDLDNAAVAYPEEGGSKAARLATAALKYHFKQDIPFFPLTTQGGYRESHEIEEQTRMEGFEKLEGFSPIIGIDDLVQTFNTMNVFKQGVRTHLGDVPCYLGVLWNKLPMDAENQPDWFVRRVPGHIWIVQTREPESVQLHYAVRGRGPFPPNFLRDLPRSLLLPLLYRKDPEGLRFSAPAHTHLRPSASDPSQLPGQ